MKTTERWLRSGNEGRSGPPTQGDLAAIVDLVARAAPGALACSITELDGATYRTVQESSPLALTLDLVQYEHGDGPCMTAARDRQTHEVPDTSSATRYGAFTAEAARRGVGCSLSVPVRTGHHAAALNIYSSRAGDFGPRARSLAELAARVLTDRLVDAAPPSLSADEQSRAARHRELILSAQRRLAVDGVSTAGAFGVLTRRSVAEGRSVFDVAADVLAAEDAV